MLLVFDAGGKTVKYACLDEQGELINKGKIRSRTDTGETLDDFVDSIVEVVDKVRKIYEIEGIAFSLPGQVDVEKGIVYGGGAYRYLHKVPLQKIISERCNLPVSLENDAKCAALAELWKGNATGYKNVLLMVFGTGLGGAVVIDGKVHSGNSLIAGEISYCVDDLKIEDIDKVGDIDVPHVDVAIEQYPNTWASHVATRSMVIHVARAKNLPIDDVTGEKIYQWIDEGDEAVIKIVENTYFEIAKYCCNSYLLLNPDIILIGGGISAQPAFVEGIRKYVNKLKVYGKVYENIKIDVCKFHNDSNLYGAAYNYMQKYNII